MTENRNLDEVTDPVTEDERLTVLLDKTGDLDKARVLHQTLPPWLVDAKPATLADLQQAHRDSQQPRLQVKALLAHIQPLHEFCAERLHAFLLSKGVAEVDVVHDQLEVPTGHITSVTPDLVGTMIETSTWHKRSLVEAAMLNFDLAQTRRGGMSSSAVIRSAVTHKPLPGLSVQQFVNYCRELDLGAAYQRHLCEVFGVGRLGEAAEAADLSYNTAAVNIGLSKALDMQIDLHIACAKEDVSAATAVRLLKMLKADRPASELAFLAPSEKPLIWQGLNIDEACLWGTLVVSSDDPGTLGTGSFLVYMPNEPFRPWYEYETLEDFKTYLRLKLQMAPYRRFFQGGLDEYDRLGFLQRFDQRKQLGRIEPVPVKGSFSDFYFKACTGKIQRDTLALAVPTALVDEQADQERWMAYLEAGLDVLNVAAFFVPVLGQLMVGVAVGQILGEVFEGVEDWSHGDEAEALQHLINIGESLAAMVAFAAGGRIVGALKSGVVSTRFFDEVEAITRTDHRPALWRPRLAPYRQVLADGEPWVADSKGIVQAKGQSWINIGGAAYSIGFDPNIGRWRINHPRRLTAYRPPLDHNYRGGWKHAFERPEQWPDLTYNLVRLDPSLEALSLPQVRTIARITDTSVAKAQHLGMEHEGLPQRFQDCVVYFKQHRKVADLIGQLERGESPQAHTARTQMLAIPLMPGWPAGRFIEVLDDEYNLLESYPDLSPFDYEDLSVHITQSQLNEGRVIPTVLEALSDEERSGLLGETVTREEAQPLFTRRLLETLNARQQTLAQTLYEGLDGEAKGVLRALKDSHPQLSNRMGWELVSEAPEAQRQHLRTTHRVPLSLAERARNAWEHTQQDRALTGLYLPELAVPATQRIALGAMQQLSGWPSDLLLQLRQQSERGVLLAEAGPPSASTQRTLVQTPEGFQAFDETSQPLAPVKGGPYGFYQAVLDALPARQRATLKLQGDWAPQQLLGRLRDHTYEQRYRVASYMRPERPPVDAPAIPCVQAAPPELSALPSALMRKLRKLFPLLDDVQRSGLIQSAKPDHLSQARAVEALEQQFAALHRALKIWRSDRSAFRPQRSPLWDYRLSRYQVAKALENGWRYMSDAIDHHAIRVPSLTLDGMLHTPLPTLPAQVSFEHVQLLSLRNMAQDDSVAYFLKHFKGLTNLNLAQNNVTRLPEVLAQMPQLEHLCLADNALQLTEYTRATLAQMRSLQVLNLSNNPLLNAPDVSRMFVLREVILRDCRLKEFPKGVSRLPYLENLDLRGNDIRALPEWLFEVPRSYAQAVNLRHNPLDARSLQLLHDYRVNHGVGMGYLEDDITRLTEQKARELWLADNRVADYADKDRTWGGLRDEPDSDGLFNLLAELGGTADASQVREDMTRRVWRVLDATSSDARLRQEIFERAATPLNCDDAAAVSFSNLEVLVEISQASRLAEGGQMSAAQLLRLARGLFRLDQLERLAYNHSLEHPSVDPLEVSLAFRTGLANRFELPGQPKHMRFANLGGVTTQNLRDAEAQVKTAELSPRLLNYLVELPFWAKYLKRTHAARFEALNAPSDERMNAVFEQSLVLDDASYREQTHSVMQEQKSVEKAEMIRLTQEALRQGDQGGCLRP
ncbi:hypothetical protein DYL59_13625 [Pseudomonas kairouanensis]|uniref:RING-type E3 ubiquitin transferase n=1 Tax=Pseudomonas kairouanensis TaxID=2293832 RepID=A0A4Z0AQ41_9PSED|nr:NEL-type E3 ubiquitin ligase domain-containing protein [Pseudomonas kairouanensis]TFY88936.1 hypothetical protein DYL59_13625 [Pseudomonas kairouanensis]